MGRRVWFFLAWRQQLVMFVMFVMRVCDGPQGVVLPGLAATARRYDREAGAAEEGKVAHPLPFKRCGTPG